MSLPTQIIPIWVCFFVLSVQKSIILLPVYDSCCQHKILAASTRLLLPASCDQHALAAIFLLPAAVFLLPAWVGRLSWHQDRPWRNFKAILNTISQIYFLYRICYWSFLIGCFSRITKMWWQHPELVQTCLIIHCSLIFWENISNLNKFPWFLFRWAPWLETWEIWQVTWMGSWRTRTSSSTASI